METKTIAEELLSKVFALFEVPVAPNGVEVSNDMIAGVFLQGLLSSKVYKFKDLETNKEDIVKILENIKKCSEDTLKELYD